MKSADPPSKCCVSPSPRVSPLLSLSLIMGELWGGCLWISLKTLATCLSWKITSGVLLSDTCNLKTCRTASSKSVWRLCLFVFTQTSCVLLRSLHIRKCWFPSNQQVMPDSVWSLFISTGCSYVLSTMHMQHFTLFDILLINCDVPLYFVWQWTTRRFYRAGALSSPTTVCWHLLITTLGKSGSVVWSSL